MKVSPYTVQKMLALGCFGTMASAWAGLPVTPTVSMSAVSLVSTNVEHKSEARLWSDMSVDERVQVWPYLDRVSRAHYWSVMNVKERDALRQRLSHRDQQEMRERYSVSEAATAQDVPERRMCDDDRHLLRRQIIEVHMELSGEHGNVEHASQP